MTAIIPTNLNTLNEVPKKEEEKKAVEIIDKYGGKALLSLTGRFGGPIKGIQLKTQSDVLDGSVEDEINKLESEQSKINDILRANTNTSLMNIGNVNLASTVPASSKSIGFVAYTGTSHTINNKTDISSVMGNFNVDTESSVSAAEQEKIFENGMNTLAKWLDDYINDYSNRVMSGIAKNESEAKLSFLLRLRKSIENCDFPVGFAPQGTNYDAEGKVSGLTLGSYNWSFNPNEYLNPNSQAYTNRGADHDLDRKLLLNTDYFAFPRRFQTEQDAINAINNGTINDGGTNPFNDIFLSNSETYYKYTGSVLAATLLHEFIHSTQISNEAVTYFSCEVIEDDFAKQLLGTVYSKPLIDMCKANGIELDNLKYEDIQTQVRLTNQDGSTVLGSFSPGHNLTTIDSIAQHGHENNMAHNSTDFPYDYAQCENGNTWQDDKKELLNFVVTA